jgi:hypothetical protein
VLVRRGVEDHLRPVQLEAAQHTVAVADVHQDHLVPRAQTGGHVVQVGLVVVEQHQRGRVERRDLAGDLGTDRPAGAGDQHAPAAQQLPDSGQIGHHLLSAEQVVDSHLTDVLEP